MKISEVLDKVLTPVIYILFAALFAFTGCYIFQEYFYTNIYVSGRSMNPTLIGTYIHSYGYADKSANAINGLKRFDVLITYYPNEWMGGVEDTVYKVKRLWGLPGETISLSYDEETMTFTFTATKNEKEFIYTSEEVTKGMFYTSSLTEKDELTVAEFRTEHKHFYTSVGTIVSDYRHFNLTLGDDEYFVMGDNWANSTDSFTNVVSYGHQNLIRKNLKGKVVCIRGVAKYDSKTKTLYDKVNRYNIYNF